MADKDRVEPTIKEELPAATAEANEPKVVEPTIEAVVQKVEALENAGATPNEFDGSEADKAYQEKVEALVKAAHAQNEKISQEAEDLLSISKRAITPGEGTPFDTYGEPLDLDVAADMRLAQIALQDEETAKKFFDKFVERVGKKNAATITPLAMSNVSLLLSPENIKDVKEVAPQYFTESYSKELADSGKSLLEGAGFSQEVIDRLDANFLRYMGATQKHEAAFPVEGPGVADRLKEPSVKSMVLDALGNKNVQRSLKWAGLIASCASGGIVVKAGMAGTKFLAGKLAENEHVRAFASKLEDRSISFVSEKFGLKEADVRKKVEKVKGSVESVFRNKWVGLATGVAVMGIAIGLGHIDAVHDAAKNVAGRFSELPYSVVEAVSTTDNSLLQALRPEGLAITVPTHVPVDIPVGPVHAAVDVPVGPGNTPEASVFSADRSGLKSGIAPEVRFPGAPEATVAVAGDSVVSAPGVDAASPVVPGADAATSASPGADTVAKAADAVTPTVGNTAHVVQAHDTVSDIAQKELQARGLPATRENIYKLVDQIYEHNKDVIGPDVNKIFPGQTISLAFEPQNLNLGQHASVAVGAHAPHVPVAAADVPSATAPRSILGVNQERMIAATGLNALNPVPKIEESVHLAAALHAAPDAAIVSVPAPTKPIVPNLAFAGTSSVSQHADVAQVMQDYEEEKLRDLADVEDKTPKRWHHPLEGHNEFSKS